MRRLRWPLIAGAVLLAYLAFRHDKFFVQLYLRLTGAGARPPVAKTEGAPPGAPTVHTVDFVDTGAAAGNLFLPPRPGEAFWQKKSDKSDTGPHVVKLRLGAAQDLELRSFNTTISYEAGRLAWLRLYPFAGPPRPYAEALAKAKEVAASTKLLASTDWARYDQALDQVPLAETYIPEAAADKAKVQLLLGCNWELGRPARAQLDRVACLPHLNFEPR